MVGAVLRFEMEQPEVSVVFPVTGRGILVAGVSDDDIGPLFASSRRSDRLPENLLLMNAIFPANRREVPEHPDVIHDFRSLLRPPRKGRIRYAALRSGKDWKSVRSFSRFAHLVQKVIGIHPEDPPAGCVLEAGVASC